MELVALNPELPPLASRFAILLTVKYFNLDYDGIGWASQDTLAEDLGYRRWAVNRLFSLLVKHGHLTYKRGGWGETNRYQMAFPDVRKNTHQEDPEHPTDVRNFTHSDVRKNTHNLLLPIPGNAQEGVPWERERLLPLPPPGFAPLRSLPVGGGKGSKGNGTAAAGNGNAAGPDMQLQILQAAWLREAHPLADTKPAAAKAQRRHLDAALKSGVPFDVIAAACKAYAAAYDVEKNKRRFLGSLEDWLGSNGWELKPPDRSGRNGKGGHYRANGSGRRKGGRKDNSQGVSDLIAEAKRRKAEKMGRTTQ